MKKLTIGKFYRIINDYFFGLTRNQMVFITTSDIKAGYSRRFYIYSPYFDGDHNWLYGDELKYLEEIK